MFKLKKSLKYIRKNLFRNIIIEKCVISILSINIINYFVRYFIVPHSEYSKKSMRLVKRNDIKLLLDISDEVDHYIYFKYPDFTFSNLNDQIKNSKLILDVGGNIGFFALYFARLSPNAKIISFEPHPRTYQRLMYNVSINNSNVEIFNYALSDRDEDLLLYEIDSTNSGMNAFRSESHDGSHVVVKAKRLDGFWNEKDKVDFVKVDTEGHELHVLKGMSKLLLNWKPSLLIEIDDINLKYNSVSPQELILFLKKMGYTSFFRSEDLKDIGNNFDFDKCHFNLYAY